MSQFLFHPSRFIRMSCSFLLVLLAYWLYGLAAVPMIEPEAEVRQSSQGRTPSRAPVAERRQSDIDALFQPDDWERRNPVMLENQRGKLLIGDYKNNPDGSVSISPCTMIMLPSGDFEDEAERVRQAVILQAVDKAVLRFDEPFDIRRGSIGKLVSGTLHGPILIRSDHKQPGPQDDLWIETRDVHLSEQHVTTEHSVQFRFGANHGTGRQMRIELAPADRRSASRGPQVDGIKSLTLFREVRLHLVPDQKQIQAAMNREANTATPSPPAKGNRWKPLPVEVTCQGPFRFDLEQRVATFQDRVDVLQVQPNGPSDQLSGELLAIHFAPRDALPGAPPPADAKEKLEPRRLEMKGNPVIVRSPSNAVHARGQRLEYEMPTRRLSLAGEPEVVVTRGGDEIRARELHYQPGEQGRLGKFMAVGPGWLRGVMPERAQPIEARWARQLWIRPDPEVPALDVVSLEGAAESRAPGMGGIKAEEIYCWLLQRPALSAPGAAETKMETAPDRLMARGNVQIDSAQLIGATEQLETWFEHPALPPPPAASPMAATTVAYSTDQPAAAPSAPAASPPPAADKGGLKSLTARPRGPADQRFDVSGKLIRIKLRMAGREADLSEVVVDGQARFAEIPNRERIAAQPPMLVEGDVLHVIQTDPQQATVTVTGKPAHVEAGGMGLRGAAINLSRGTNQLWIDGDGLMTMQVDRDMQGRPLEKVQPLEVRWQGRMNFNGLVATFERMVAAQTQQQVLRTELLEITLSQRVDFAQPKQAQRPDVAEVVCRGGVVLDSKTYDEQGLASLEHLETADLSLNRMTGAVLANAFTQANRPALMVQVRRGDNRAGLAVPGGGQDAAGGSKEEGLSYLHVQFHRNLVGDINRREMAFGDRVKTVYGPVPTWDSVLTPEQLGERGILLTCDLMKVREMPTANADVRSTELEALGNTSVEGSGDSFRATSATLRYSSEKGKLTLEGDGRRDVVFSQRLQNGGVRNGSARRIDYRPEKRHLTVTEVTSGSAIDPPR